MRDILQNWVSRSTFMSVTDDMHSADTMQYTMQLNSTLKNLPCEFPLSIRSCVGL